MTTPWFAMLREMDEISGSVFKAVPVLESEKIAYLIGAAAGRPDYVVMVIAIALGEKLVAGAIEGHEMPCMRCGRPTANRPHNFCMIVPDVPSPPFAVPLAICAECGDTADGVCEAAMPYLAANFVRLRRLPSDVAMPPPGTA